MFKLSESNTSVGPFLYCPSIVFMGSFLLMNLLLAVIMESFEQKKKLKKQQSWLRKPKSIGKKGNQIERQISSMEEDPPPGRAEGNHLIK